MSTVTDIEWTDVTWNPVRGCSLVSAGCAHCYAMKQAHRFSGAGKPYEGLTELGPQGPRWTGTITLVPERLDEPLRWKRPRRVFVNSMSDLFHEDVPDEFIDQVFAVMALTPHHTYQLLTKRPQRMQTYCHAGDIAERIGDAACAFGKSCYALPRSAFDIDHDADGKIEAVRVFWPLKNIHLCVSAEDQTTLDQRTPILLQTPAVVRGLSLEPLLGPIDLSRWLPRGNGWEQVKDVAAYGEARPRLAWVVVGGESGPGARPCDVAWIRSIVRQCRAAGVPCFVKQLGSQPRGWCVDRLHGDEPESAYEADHCGWYEASEIPKPCAGRCLVLYDRKGGDPAEWPADLRVREWPR